MIAESLPRNRDIWRIAAPMILSNVTVPMLGMVDTGVTGHLDEAAYLGAVAVGSALFGFLYTGVNFLRMGTTGIAAQRFGADDYEGLRVALGQALVASLAVAALLLLFQRPIGRIAIDLLGARGEVQENANAYFSIRIWSAPATLAGYALIGWFIGLANARIPLLVVVTVNATNIFLDLLFVLGLGMKVEGVALASVIAEYLGVAIGLVFAARILAANPGTWHPEKFLRLREYTAFFAINANLFVRTMALMFTFSFVTAQGARMGPLILAANAVLMNFVNLTSFALDGIAHAAEALVGHAVGGRRRDVLEESVRLSLLWSLVFAAGFAAFYLVAGPSIIRLLTDLDGVRDTAMRYLPWLVVAPLIAVWPFLYDGVFVGATRAREMRDIMLASALLVFLPAWYLTTPLGNHGLWLSFMLFFASRGVGMHLYYRKRVLPAVAGA